MVRTRLIAPSFFIGRSPSLSFSCPLLLLQTPAEEHGAQCGSCDQCHRRAGCGDPAVLHGWHPPPLQGDSMGGVLTLCVIDWLASGYCLWHNQQQQVFNVLSHSSVCGCIVCNCTSRDALDPYTYAYIQVVTTLSCMRGACTYCATFPPFSFPFPSPSPPLSSMYGCRRCSSSSTLPSSTRKVKMRYCQSWERWPVC